MLCVNLSKIYDRLRLSWLDWKYWQNLGGQIAEIWQKVQKELQNLRRAKEELEQKVAGLEVENLSSKNELRQLQKEL